jgi:large subunit ribosomal protein L30e
LSLSLVDLEKQLKAVTKTGKYIVGRKEVLNGLKGSKLVVWSASANVPPKILEECKSLQVPAIRFDGNPIELGKSCGIPYKVSVIAVKSAGDAAFGSLEKFQDYSNPGPGLQRPQSIPSSSQDLLEKGPKKQVEPVQARSAAATKKKKKTKKSKISKEPGRTAKSKKKEGEEKEEKVKTKDKAALKKNKKEEGIKEEEIEAQAEEDTDEEEEE